MNTYKFSNHDDNKFISLLQKGVEYIDDWEKFDETWLPEKENFYRHLSMEALLIQTMPMRRVCKDFEIKSLREYHDLYVQGNTLLLADVFETFWSMCV